MCHSRATAALLALLTLVSVTGTARAQTARSGGGANAQLLQQMQQLASDRTSLQAENAKLKKDLEDLRKERGPLASERDRLSRYAEAALAIKDAYSDSQKKHVKQQMADFVRVISALFLRMQSNLVYDDVASGDEAAPLSWRAQAENLNLDPEATFSQGQRQDFALSIFLARARGQRRCSSAPNRSARWPIRCALVFRLKSVRRPERISAHASPVATLLCATVWLAVLGRNHKAVSLAGSFCNGAVPLANENPCG